MYNEDYYYDVGYNNRKSKFSLSNLNLKGKLILGGVLLVIVIIIVIVINNVKNYYNSYEYLEKQMTVVAKEYVENNNLIITDEIYLDVSKLSMDIKDTCSKISGVFVDNKYNYQAYLSCDNYQSDVINNNETKASLNGEEVVLIAKGINYEEPGIKGSREVIVQGEVGTEEGVYNLNYFVNQNNIPVAVLKRKVVIVDNSYIKSLFPTITLKGDNIVYLQKGNTYQEIGVLAGDNVDFDLSNKVKINSNVDVNNEGEYEVSYTVTNSRGYTNRVIRKVIVVDNFATTTLTASLSTYNQTNNDVMVNIKIIGNEYDYVLLPDKSIVRGSSISYKVSSNGTYNFIAYDKDGKSTTKIVLVNNIDKEKPSGVCNAIVYNDYANIVVNPNSGKKISSYMYIVNGVSSNELSSSSYKASVNGKVNNVSVMLKDSVGNTNTITCEISDKQTDDMEIVPIPAESFKCNTDVSYYNQQLANKVSKAGIKTRLGVVAAANYLATELGYRIEYWWAGKYDKVGLNSEWGCGKAIWDTEGWGKYTYGSVWPYGMDCTGFVKWAFINGGFDAELIPRGDMSYYYGTVMPTRVEFSANSSLINNLQIGDVLFAPGHYALVVGVDDTRIKLAQLVGAGLKVDLIDKFTGKAITDTSDFTAYILLEEFYQKYGN